MPLPDAPAQRSDSERISLLELDMLWVKKTTNKTVDELSGKMDTLLSSFAEFKSNIKTEIKSDLNDEFERRFVPKKALWISMGVSLGVGLVAGAAFQPVVKTLIAFMVA